MWAKLDLQLGPANGHCPGPPVAGGEVGAQPPQVRRRGPAARAWDARRRQEWQERRKETALQLPASHDQEPRTQIEPDPEQQSQPDEIIDNNTDKIPQLDGPAETPNDTPVKLELDDDGYIVGPNIPKNASPPARVFHPKTGIGIFHGESGDPAFFTYLFPDDPDAHEVSEGPKKGQKIASMCEVFPV